MIKKSSPLLLPATKKKTTSPGRSPSRLLYAVGAFFLIITSAVAQLTQKQQSTISSAIPRKAFVPPQKTRKILVLTTGAQMGRDSGAQFALQQMSLQTKAFALSFSDKPGDFTLKNLKKYDAVLFNNTANIENFFTSEKQQKEFEQYIREGGALIAIHKAAQGGWPAYTKILGGRATEARWKANKTWTFVKEDKENSSVAHFPEIFKFQDAVYLYENFQRSAVRVLLALDFGDRDTRGNYSKERDVPVSWI
ncbi:MAG: ThuA domain-containing protein, partial [Lentisphaeraceae bacterium]|nr:ThuA domain-containing protein [Lentisphaeraceae bacterium]